MEKSCRHCFDRERDILSSTFGVSFTPNWTSKYTLYIQYHPSVPQNWGSVMRYQESSSGITWRLDSNRQEPLTQFIAQTSFESDDSFLSPSSTKLEVDEVIKHIRGQSVTRMDGSSETFYHLDPCFWIICKLSSKANFVEDLCCVISLARQSRCCTKKNLVLILETIVP